MKPPFPALVVVACVLLAWLTPMSWPTRALATAALGVCLVIEARSARRQRGAR